MSYVSDLKTPVALRLRLVTVQLLPSHARICVLMRLVTADIVVAPHTIVPEEHPVPPERFHPLTGLQPSTFFHYLEKRNEPPQRVHDVTHKLRPREFRHPVELV